MPIKTIPQILLAGIVTAIAIWGGFNDKELLRDFILTGVILCIVGLAIAPTLRHARIRLAAISLLALILAAAIFVYWRAIMDAGRANAIVALQSQYPDKVPMWS